MYYILQIIEHDDIGTIRDVSVTNSHYKAEKWLHKRLKTDRYFHGYITLGGKGNE